MARPLIRFYDEFGEIFIDVRSRAARSLIAHYHNAINRWLETRGDLSQVRKFRGKTVIDARGKKHPFITNPRILRRLARSGALGGFEDIYSISS